MARQSNQSDQTSNDVLNAAAAAMLRSARQTQAGRDALRSLSGRHCEELEAAAADHRARLAQQ
jgi:hypothetical protein